MLNLKQYAQTLNIPVDDLWTVLMKQAYINATLGLFALAACLTLLTLAYNRKVRAEMEINGADYSLMFYFAMLITAVVALYTVPQIVTVFLNPDYLPIERLLRPVCGK